MRVPPASFVARFFCLVPVFCVVPVVAAPASAAGAAAFSWKTRSMAHRNADSVLPDPVGATTRACRPAKITSHAPVWAVVGCAKAPRNQSCVAGPNRSSTFAIDPSSRGPPTSGRALAPGEQPA